MQKTAPLDEGVQDENERAKERAEGDDCLGVDADGVAVLGVEIPDQSRTGHQSAAVAATTHIHYSATAGGKPFDRVCTAPAEWKTLIFTPELVVRERMTVTLKDFYADWCGPCKTQDPILEDLEAEYENVEFEKVNVDEEQDVANEYQVRSLPTLIIENDDGIVERFVGVTQAEDIEAAFEQAGA